MMQFGMCELNDTPCICLMPALADDTMFFLSVLSS